MCLSLGVCLTPTPVGAPWYKFKASEHKTTHDRTGLERFWQFWAFFCAKTLIRYGDAGKGHESVWRRGKAATKQKKQIPWWGHKELLFLLKATISEHHANGKRNVLWINPKKWRSCSRGTPVKCKKEIPGLLQVYWGNYLMILHG